MLITVYLQDGDKRCLCVLKQRDGFWDSTLEKQVEKLKLAFFPLIKVARGIDLSLSSVSVCGCFCLLSMILINKLYRFVGSNKQL